MYPSQGGFGHLDWQNHIIARQTKWAHRLLIGDDDTPWIWILRLYLTRKGFPVIRCLVDKQEWSHWNTKLPDAVTWLWEGMQRLPSPSWNEIDPVTNLLATTYIPSLPIWGNYPWIGNAEGGSEIWVRGKSSSIQTFGQYITAWRSLAPLSEGKQIRLWAKMWKITIPRTMNRKAHILSFFGEIWVKIPDRIKIMMHIHYMVWPWTNWELQWTTIKSVVLSMRWGLSNANVDQQIITVREATMLIRDPTPKNKKWKKFTDLANANLTDDMIGKRMRDIFRRLWKCEVLNRFKEPFWRLVYDAIPTPARVHLPHLTCICGQSNPDRNHCFWDCDIFQGMILYLEQKLGCTITKEMVWLVHAPETIYVRVWEVLVLYMISSMDSVRRREIRSRLLGQEAKNSEWWKQRTIAIFKKHINNFVVMTDLVPCRWNVPILQTHPFISAGLGNEEGEVPPGRDSQGPRGA